MPPNQRQFERHITRIKAHIRQDRVALPCLIQDVSGAGARLTFEVDTNLLCDGEPVQFAVPGFGSCEAELRWIGPAEAGLEFQITPSQKLSLARILNTKLADEF